MTNVSAEKEFANDVILNLVKTANLLTTMADQFFKPYNVTTAQYNVLVILKNSKNKISQQELSSRMVVSRSDITAIIDKLEKLGCVKRVAHGTDRRIKLLEINQKGIDLVKQVDDKYYQRLAQVIKNVNQPDLKRLDKLVSKLKSGI